eukprot:scaffold300793_cov23-Tisochrysis_lutea.AAC.1
MGQNVSAAATWSTHPFWGGAREKPFTVICPVVFQGIAVLLKGGVRRASTGLSKHTYCSL